MNRLIIVGNGFDLAHNLKTSYCDFLEDYLRSVIKSFLSEGQYDDPLMSLNYKYTGMKKGISTDPDDSIYEIVDYIRTDTYFNLNFKSELLRRSLNKSKALRWVDLENEYFDEVLSHLKKVRNSDFGVVKTLNDQFDFMKSKLESYLLTQQMDLDTFEPDPLIKDIFNEKLRNDDIVFKTPRNLSIDNILFLNFNYTNSLTKYINNSEITSSPSRGKAYRPNETLVHIHGELANTDNNIIFGFGDEYDEEYLKFESLKTNEVFKHIKSFAYFQTRNYDQLIRFLDQDEYQVFIIGHSCGLSDRTMFREIFEHKNCLSIKIFYHKIDEQNDDFTDKTFEIARHFTDKNAMRKKIAKKPNSTFLPQYKY